MWLSVLNYPLRHLYRLDYFKIKSPLLDLLLYESCFYFIISSSLHDFLSQPRSKLRWKLQTTSARLLKRSSDRGNEVTDRKLNQVLGRIKLNTQPSLDQISNRILRHHSQSYFKPLLAIVSFSRVNLEWPLRGRTHNWPWLPKSQPSLRTLPNADLTSCVGKVVERVVNSMIFNFLESNNHLLSKSHDSVTTDQLPTTSFSLPRKPARARTDVEIMHRSSSASPKP